MFLSNKLKFKQKLFTCALASTLFSFVSVSYAFTDLDAAANGQLSNNPAYPPTTGYNFIASNVDFVIDNGAIVGTTGTVSIDNNNPLIGQPFSNVTLTVFEGATIQGDIGPSNPIDYLKVVQFNAPGNTLTLQGSSININAIELGPFNGYVNLALDGTNLELNGTVSRLLGTGGALNLDINKAATINGNITDMAAVTLNDNLTLNADITANSVAFAADKTLTIGASKLVNSEITTTAGNNTGTILFEGDSTISHHIGAGADRLKQITLPNNVQSTVTVNGGLSISSEQISVNNQNRLMLTGATYLNSSLNVNTGGVVGFNQLSNATIGFDVPTNKLQTQAGSIIEVDMTGIQVNLGGFILNDSDTGPVLDPNTIVRLTNIGANAPSTLTLLVDNGVNAGATLPASLVTSGGSSSLLSQISVSKVGNALNLNITSLPLTALTAFTDQPNIFNLSQLLIDTNATSPTGELSSIVNSLRNFTDAESLRNALATLTPIVDGAVVTQSFENQHQAFGYAGERMSRLGLWRNHLGKGSVGVATGDGSSETEKSTWAKVFHQYDRQDTKDFLPGYKDNITGIVLGTDNTYNDAFLIGAALGYSYIDTHHQISDNAKTRTNSVQAMLYSALNCDSPLFLTLQVGGGYNHYDFNRTITFPTFAYGTTGDTNGWQLGANSEVGYVFDIRSVHVVPSISAFYSHLKMDSYVEEGAGTANQSIANNNFDAFVLGAGIQLAKDFLYKETWIQPELHAYYYYDVINDRMSTLSSFVGYSAGYEAFGLRREPEVIQLGLSLNLFSKAQSTFTFSYDQSFNHDYVSHTGFITWRYALA